MIRYDVIVVGAGPAGSSAAEIAAQKGAKTVLIEEHRLIGLPRHCSGRLHGSSVTSEIISRIDKRVLLSECRARRFYSPKGQLVHEDSIDPRTAYMIIRDEFDRELARNAGNAGVDILLNTKVTGLLKQDGRIIGVATSSRIYPKVEGSLVICGQGSSSRVTGIPAQENLSDHGENFRGGVLLELQNVRGLDSGTNEIHLGAMADIGFARIWTRDDHSCWATCPSLEAFEMMRNSQYVYGEKVRKSQIIQIHGAASGSKSGSQLPCLVKDGLMLVGDSAGYTSMIHGIVSGRYAGEVAVTALGKGDIRQSCLKEYQDKCERRGLHLTGHSWKTLTPLKGKSDEEIEAMIPGMISRQELKYADILPF